MASSISQYALCSLVQDRTLTLETEATADSIPVYNGVLVIEDTLLVTDYYACDLQLYSRSDGKLLYTSHRLESIPMGVCLISKREFSVCLWNGKMIILSFKSVDDVKLVKTLDVRTGIHSCHSVAKLNSSDKVVVSGEKYENDWMLCWCVVNLTDGCVETSHKICKGGSSTSHLAITGNTVYISCWTGDSTVDGLYAYDIFHPNTHKFLYQHKELQYPGSVMVDRRYSIYVYDENSNSIHQLTDRGHLVTIHTVSSMLYGIFFDAQHGVLYTTSYCSNVITLYSLEYLHQSGIPAEILNMDDRSIQLFKEALQNGTETVHSIRVMVVGHFGVGKTTLVKRLLGEDVNSSERNCSEGTDVYVNFCDVSLSTHEWTRRTKDSEQDYQLQHLARVLNEQQLMTDKATSEKQVKLLPQGKTTHRGYEVAYVADEDKELDILYSSSPHQDISHDLSSNASQKVESLPAMVQREPFQSETNMISMLKLLQENVHQLKQEKEETLPLTMWDFADQYSFYTTHHMTRRAIYLLVSDITKQLADLVGDECYFDSKGMMKCKVQDLIEFWLNSIHYCTPSTDASIPPVILVGTHVDKMSQSGHYEIREICNKYFREIRICLENKPSRIHLVNEEFAIDNTVVDRRLEDLKRKIVELASQQPYCHVEIPARWIPLQQMLMRLKEAGVKVIPTSLLKEMNQTGVVPLSTEELDLFLRFQHGIGTILYFSLHVLREKIVLEPQWLIDALKSIINADKMFILSLSRAVTVKWLEFKTNLNLSPELIDAIWTKERNQDFYASKEHLLHLMEQLNIIVKPRSYTKDGKEIKFSTDYVPADIKSISMIDRMPSINFVEIGDLVAEATLSEYISSPMRTFQFSSEYESADTFPSLDSFHLLVCDDSADLPARYNINQPSEYITSPWSRLEQKMVSSEETHTRLSDRSVYEEYQKSLQEIALPPEMTTEWNFTVNEIQDAWPSLEVYLSDELHPNCLLIFFEKERILSAEECEEMCKLRRREVVKELLQRIKVKLSEAFSSFLHALNETKQQVIVQGMRKQIEGIDVPQPSTHGQETNAVAYYTFNMELLKDGITLHETESKTRAYMDKGCMVFDFEMRSQCLKWESGSIIVYLRPLGKLTKERLDLFCQHGGMKNFMLDLLKKKDIFPSLPGGDISIHIQVCCYDKDTGSEDADADGDTQMNNIHSVIQDSLRVTDSFIVTDKTEVIKQNLINQYEYMIEEIEPLNFKDTFVNRGISDMSFFEKLKMRRRKERATDFLNDVLDKGNSALEALVHDLRDSGLDDLVRRLCIAPEKNKGQVDDGLIEVVREDSASPESMVFIVRKNEDGDRKPEVMGSNDGIEPVTAETSTQLKQKRDSVDEIASAVTDQTTSEECQEPLQKRALPPGKKYHAFFSYSSSDIPWVKQTVDRLEKDHGFVCCEYDRDNTPGTPLLKFAEDSIRNAHKTVVVMTGEAFQSGFVLLEVDMAIRQGLDESRKCVVPILLKDCEVPLSLRILNYVDVRDTEKIEIWLPKLVMELET